MKEKTHKTSVQQQANMSAATGEHVCSSYCLVLTLNRVSLAGFPVIVLRKMNLLTLILLGIPNISLTS